MQHDNPAVTNLINLVKKKMQHDNPAVTNLINLVNKNISSIAKDQSLDFINNKKEFQLHNLITEQPHPLTLNLSEDIQSNPSKAIQSLLSVDHDLYKCIDNLDITACNQLIKSIEYCLTYKKKSIYMVVVLLVD